MKKIMGKRVFKIFSIGVILVIACIAILYWFQLSEHIVPLKTSHEDYTLEKIEEITGRNNWSEWDFEIGGVECKEYYYPGTDETNYDTLSFYIFTSERKAKRAYRYIHNSWFSEITDEGKYYVEGWEDGVCDAFVKELVCLSGNMIITTPTVCISAWIEGDEDEEAVEYDETNDESDIKDFVLEEFY